MSAAFTIFVVWADGHGFEESLIMSAHDTRAGANLAKARLDRRAEAQRKAWRKWMAGEGITNTPRRDLADKARFRVHALRVRSS